MNLSSENNNALPFLSVRCSFNKETKFAIKEHKLENSREYKNVIAYL